MRCMFQEFSRIDEGFYSFYIHSRLAFGAALCLGRSFETSLVLKDYSYYGGDNKNYQWNGDQRTLDRNFCFGAKT